MNVDQLNNQIENIISHQACFAVAQTYEFFEIFLIDIITEYFFHNQGKLKIIGLGNGKLILAKEAIRKEVKGIKEGNKGRFSILRKTCSFFQKHEVKNIYNYSITE
jgi:predicted site-specific integrase-resolvase